MLHINPRVCFGILRRGGWQGRYRRDDSGTHTGAAVDEDKEIRGRHPLLAAPSRFYTEYARKSRTKDGANLDVVNRRRVPFSAGWPRLFCLGSSDRVRYR